MRSRKYEVCPRCEGEGYVSKLGAFTASDLDEWYGDGPERQDFLDEYRTPGGIYDEVCPCCSGKRVVTAEEEEAYEDRVAEDRVRAAESGWAYGY